VKPENPSIKLRIPTCRKELNRTIENLLDSSAKITEFVSGSLQLAKVTVQGEGVQNGHTQVQCHCPSATIILDCCHRWSSIFFLPLLQLSSVVADYSILVGESQFQHKAGQLHLPQLLQQGEHSSYIGANCEIHGQ
jgi:hypothetical protein